MKGNCNLSKDELTLLPGSSFVGSCSVVHLVVDARAGNDQNPDRRHERARKDKSPIYEGR